MDYKMFLYAIFIFITAIGVSGINTNGFFKKNKILEAKIFMMVISIVLGYLLTNFVIDFLNLTSIL